MNVHFIIYCILSSIPSIHISCILVRIQASETSKHTKSLYYDLQKLTHILKTLINKRL